MIGRLTSSVLNSYQSKGVKEGIVYPAMSQLQHCDQMQKCYQKVEDAAS